MSRPLVLLYGFVTYALFLAGFVALVLFLADVVLPRTVDRGPVAPWPEALAIDLALMAAFGISHSVMARPRFKRAIEHLVPAAIERSTYVLVSMIAIGALITLWRPLPAIVWHTEGIAAHVLTAVYCAGVLLVLIATFAIDHFELFGVSQVIAHARGREHRPPAFRLTPLYRVVRHPLYVGWIVTFFVTPTMSLGHLLFAVVNTAYILIAIGHEERDLLAAHGPAYASYRAQVPKLVPNLMARGKPKA